MSQQQLDKGAVRHLAGTRWNRHLETQFDALADAATGTVSRTAVLALAHAVETQRDPVAVSRATLIPAETRQPNTSGAGEASPTDRLQVMKRGMMIQSASYGELDFNAEGRALLAQINSERTRASSKADKGKLLAKLPNASEIYRHPESGAKLYVTRRQNITRP